MARCEQALAEAKRMPRRQRFATARCPGLGTLQAATAEGSGAAQDADALCFATGRGGRLLLRASGAGAGCRRTRGAAVPAAFCSVTATAAAGNHTTPSLPAPSAPSLERLPVAVKRGDRLLPYVWDGRRISAMDESALAERDVAAGRLRNWALGLQRRLVEAFLPDPRDVTPDYWEWLRWRLAQRFFSSTMQNFSFSALLMATGLGAKKSFAASAAINWLLKDGVSRIVRMSVATSFGQTFDADLKRMRFVTSLIFTACMAGEFATPFWPHHFVALASVSSVGRAVGLSAFVATQPAFQAALATGGNLADLTSKNQAQHMVMDMAALGVSAGLTWLLRAAPRGGLMLPALMYPLCAAGDLFCIWRELKAVQLRSLNRERAEMVIERWLARGTAPDAAEISAAESLVLPSDVWGGLLPLRIATLPQLAPTPEGLGRLLRLYEGEQYVLAVDRRAQPPPPKQQRQRQQHQQQHAHGSGGGGGPGGAGGAGESGGGGSGWRLRLPWLGGAEAPAVLVSFSDRASSADITQALLHTACLRRAVLAHCAAARPLSAPPHHHKQHHRHSHDRPDAHAHAAHHLAYHRQQHHHHQQHQQQQQQHAEHPDADDRRHSRAAAAAASSSASTSTKGGGSGGGGGGSSSGHTHDHVHWDEQRHVLYHHTHYHTHDHAADRHSHHHDTHHPYHDHEGELLRAHHAARGAALAHTASVSLSRHAGAGDAAASAAAAAAAAAGPAHAHGPPPPPPRPQPDWRSLDDATWAQLVQQSRHEAARQLPRLLVAAEQAGWKLSPIMLSTSERAQYVRL